MLSAITTAASRPVEVKIAFQSAIRCEKLQSPFLVWQRSMNKVQSWVFPSGKAALIDSQRVVIGAVRHRHTVGGGPKSPSATRCEDMQGNSNLINQRRFTNKPVQLQMALPLLLEARTLSVCRIAVISFVSAFVDCVFCMMHLSLND
jgi:hypothetical protein